MYKIFKIVYKNNILSMYINKIYVYNSSVRLFLQFFSNKTITKPNTIGFQKSKTKPNPNKIGFILSVWFGFLVWIGFYPNREHPY